MFTSKHATNLSKFYQYAGLTYLFEPNGPLQPEFYQQKFTELDPTNQAIIPNLLDIISEWDGEFASLTYVRVALETFTQCLFQIDRSQNRIIENLQRYYKLESRDFPYSGGLCAGLSCALGGDIISQANVNLEHVYYQIANANVFDAEFERNVKVIEAYVFPLHVEQYNERKFNELFNLSLETFQFAWVHTTQSLTDALEHLLKPEKLIRLGASRHAAILYQNKNGDILYYNPNVVFGKLIFSGSDSLQRLMATLPSGFSGCYPERFGLNIRVYDTNEQMQNSLTDMLLKSMLSATDAASALNRTDSKGRTALHLCAVYDNAIEMAKLIALGANPNQKDIDGLAPIHYAEEETILSILASPTILVNQLDPKGFTPLHQAIYEGELKLAATLIDHPRIFVNARVAPKHINFAGYSPLMLASELGHLSIVEKLLLHPDAQVNFPRLRTCETPLHVAIQNNHQDIVQKLMSIEQTLIDATSHLPEEEELFPHGKSALCYAMEYILATDGEFTIALALLEANADIKFLPNSWAWYLLETYCFLNESFLGNFEDYLKSQIEAGNIVVDKNDPATLKSMEYILDLYPSLNSIININQPSVPVNNIDVNEESKMLMIMTCPAPMESQHEILESGVVASLPVEPAGTLPPSKQPLQRFTMFRKEVFKEEFVHYTQCRLL